MEMFWARILRSFGSTDTLGSTDGPKRKEESRTWCLDCQHTSAFCKVFTHFPNNPNSRSKSLFFIGTQIVSVGL